MSNLPIKAIVIHASATKPGMDIGRHEIDAWHRQRGWNGIGYHYVIRRSGAIEIGRQEHDQGAHVRGHNRNTLGICMIGGLDAYGDPEDNYTEEQFASLHALLVNMIDHHGEDVDILGHRDYSPDLDGDGVIEEFEWLKACPCFDVRKWCEENL